ncbi:hypothetical protein VDG1235_2957 [Verrucomicrobiia bacterium DG1235]|nr:hypothetical protein VDG1235_2957 [Verrucomicrobiae bacterium DG1235]
MIELQPRLRFLCESFQSGYLGSTFLAVICRLSKSLFLKCG